MLLNWHPFEKKLEEIQKQIADVKARHTRTTLVTVAVEPRTMRVCYPEELDG